MDLVPPPPSRVSVKHQGWLRAAADRRRDMVNKQRQARRDLTAHARRLAEVDRDADLLSEVEAMEISTPSKSKRQTREDRMKSKREHFAQQLVVPEWMVDVPSDLNGNGSTTGAGWYVMPRPEGKRCLVTTSNGITLARTQSGSVLKRFPSALPGGSRKTATSTEAYCILDCIFHEPNGIFYVLDVMCWKGYLLYNCTVDFRLYWLRDKLDEGSAGSASSANPFPFLPLPCYECDEHGLQTAYETQFPFQKDGLLFYLKAGHYELGLSPLVLVWKDALTSPYFTFTEKPTIVLRLDAANKFTTLEGMVLWTPEDSFLATNELTEGDLAKFTFDQGYFGEDHQPHLLGLVFHSRCSPQRALADSWTKILFQFNARSGGLPIQRILEVARKPALTDEKMVDAV